MRVLFHFSGSRDKRIDIEKDWGTLLVSDLDELTWPEVEKLIPILVEMGEAYKNGELSGPEADAMIAIVQSVWTVIAPVIVTMWKTLEPMLEQFGYTLPKKEGG